MRIFPILRIIVCCILVWAAAGCTRQDQAERSKGEQDLDGFYLLSDSGLDPVASFPQTDTSGFIPWAAALLCSGMSEQGDTIYLCINTIGLLPLLKTGNGITSGNMMQFPEFRNRSVGTFFSDREQLYIHLYRNTFFEYQGPTDHGDPVYRFEYPSGTLESLGLSFPDSDGRWELVDLIPEQKQWTLAWKRTSPERTVFRYYRYNHADNRSIPISKSDYRETYQIRLISEAPDHILRLFEMISSPGNIVQITLSTFGESGKALFSSVSPETLKRGVSAMTELPALTHNGFHYLFDGRSRIYWMDRKNNSGRINLPGLPDHYRYTGFLCDGRYLVVSWEEQQEHRVGFAGIYVKTVSLAE